MVAMRPISPPAPVVKVTGVITAGAAVRIPVILAMKPAPITVTPVPTGPLVGVRVSVTTLKGACAMTPPTVAMKVAGPTGAPGSMVAMRANVPFAPTVKDAGAMTPAGIAVRVPGRWTGKPVPLTVTAVPGTPLVGISVMAAAVAPAGAAVTAMRLATRARTVSTLNILCFVFIYVSPFFFRFKVQSSKLQALALTSFFQSFKF
jgi:hypothetical protein